MPDAATAVPDLSACAREPIHLIEAVQAHGALLALTGDDLRIVKASANANRLLGLIGATDALLGQPLGDPCPELAQAVAARLADLGPLARRLPAGTAPCHASAHRNADGFVLVELESPGAPGPLGEDPLLALSDFAQELSDCGEEDACRAAAAAVQALSGYGRVMIYRFSSSGDGEVVAESLAPGEDSYLGLRFPASDIPPQARAAFDAVGVRIIADASAPDAPLLPSAAQVAGRALDLGRCGLRAVSPIHLEYLRNMRVRASLTAAIRIDGALWGLIACHHGTPRGASPALREFAGLAAGLLAARLTAIGRSLQHEARMRADAFQRDLLARFSAEGPEWVGDLMRPESILPVLDANGAALFIRGVATAVGEIGSGEPLRALLERIAARLGDGDLLAIESIGEELPEAGPQPFAGLLAVRISASVGDLLVWTRGEAVREVRWAGDPRNKVVRDPDTGRLSPRTSFAAWSEQVRGRCRPWFPDDLAVARALLSDLRGVIGTVYGARQVLIESNRRFRDFSHMVAHDLQEPLRGVAGFCGIIQRRWNASLPQQGQDYLRQALEGAHRMQRMITDVLAFAAIQSVEAPMVGVDLVDAAQEAVAALRSSLDEQGGEVRIGDLPVVRGHRRLVVQLLQNLVGNGIKYRDRDRPPRIAIEAELVAGRWQIAVSDNGIGIAHEHHQRMFDVFTRIARDSGVQGHGIGLALCKSIVELHGGEIWVDSELGVGTTITCAIPAR